MDLKQLQADPAIFRRGLLIDADGKRKRLGTALDEWQARDFAVLDAGWRRVAGQEGDGLLRAYLERPRGHSKTSDLAVMACWVLFASRRQLRGYGAAADQDQARLLRDAIESLLRINPWLGQILRADKLKVVNVRTGSTLEVLTSDAPTSYGLLPDFIIADELVHWGGRDLWDSLLSSAAKRKNCMVVIISNAGFAESWQWETREAIRQDKSWYFSRLDGPVASWITEERLAEQRRLLPRISFDRLWMNLWGSGSGDAIDPADIDAAITLPGPQAAEAGWHYVGGLDLGLRKDASALVILGVHTGWTEEIEKEPPPLSPTRRAMVDAGIAEATEPDNETIYHEGTGRRKVCNVKLWRPDRGKKVNLETVENAVIELDRRYHLSGLGYDPWQCEYLADRLRKANVPTQPVQFVPGNLQAMAQATLEAFGEGQIDLYNHPQLLADLRALRVVERGYGIRLESPRGPNGHGDAATGLSIALHMAKKEMVFFSPVASNTMIVY